MAQVLEEGGLFVFSTELAHEDDTMEARLRESDCMALSPAFLS